MANRRKMTYYIDRELDELDDEGLEFMKDQLDQWEQRQLEQLERIRGRKKQLEAIIASRSHPEAISDNNEGQHKG